MVSAVPVPERLWEVAPPAGPAALSPADNGSIEARGAGVETLGGALKSPEPA